MLFLKLELKKERKPVEKHFSFTMTTLTNFAVKYFLLKKEGGTSFYPLFLHLFSLSLVLLFVLLYLTLTLILLMWRIW